MSGYRLYIKLPLVRLAACAAIIWASTAGFQPAKAGASLPALTIADIDMALRGAPEATGFEPRRQSDRTTAGDSAVAALAAYSAQIPDARRRAGGTSLDNAAAADPAYSALQDFAQSLDSAPLTSLKNLPKLAEADNALDALRDFLQGGATPKKSSAGPTSNGPVAGGKVSAPAVDATYVGAKVCLTCHASQAEAFGKTLMGRIGKTQKGKFDCENCHGPGSAHAKAGGGRSVGGIISFRPEDQSRTAEENNEICLTCHQKGNRAYWDASTHETRGLMCTNCHTVMKDVSRKSQLKTAFQPDTCFQCHKDRKAQMYRSGHMPIREGKVMCSDCHNPHGSTTASMLKGESINATCYRCHAEKRGPFLFEHLPVRESCMNCHEPHGSVNEFSLRVSRPRLCQECHNIAHGETSARFTVPAQGRACNNCHTQVHGSNSPAGGALQR